MFSITEIEHTHSTTHASDSATKVAETTHAHGSGGAQHSHPSPTTADTGVSHTHIIGHAVEGVTIIKEYDHAHDDGDTHHTHIRMGVTEIDEAFVTVLVSTFVAIDTPESEA
jgi:hypothetical protein